MTKQHLKPPEEYGYTARREPSLSRRTDKYERLLQTLRKRGPQPWVRSSHERNQCQALNTRPKNT